MCIRDRSDPSYALWIICFLRIWQFGSAMVLFLAALKGVPADLYEAATIDGAGKWKQFFSITVPMITPILFYNLVDVYKRQVTFCASSFLLHFSLSGIPAGYTSAKISFLSQKNVPNRCV